MLNSDPAAVRPLSISPGVPDAAQLKEFINAVYAMGAADIKFASGDWVWADINRCWTRVSDRRLQPQEVERILTIVNDQSALGLISSGCPVDARVDLYRSADATNEFRLNATGSMVAGSRDGIAITLRSIPQNIPSLAQLGIEQEIVDNLFPRYGLILVIGTTGSGKSTLLAAANRERLVNRRHDPVTIGTYEDPIEYSLAGLAEGSMPEPVQMAIGPGRHLQHFADIGRNAMRRRFDVIVAGEIRDLESAKAAGELARTGHAVLATLHTDAPGEAIDRLIKLHPHAAQEGEAFALLGQLRLVVAQKLARTTDGGKIAFRSWIVFDRALRKQLEQTPIANWPSAIGEVIKSRGADFEQAAAVALAAGRITLETFRDVSGMTAAEAAEFLSHRGGGL